MYKKYLIVISLLILMGLQKNILAQIVSVGSGSYTTNFPGTDAASRNGFPSGNPQLSGVASGKPVPTNDWWSKLVKENHADNLFNYPMTLKTTNKGLVVSYIPWGVIDDQEPIVVGTTGLNASSATVADHSDWTVTINWNDKLQATVGIGMPFLYFEKKDAEQVEIQINLGMVTVSNEMIVVNDARNGADFVIYAPSGSSWTQNGSVYTSSLNGENYWSVAMLPQDVSNVTTAAEEFKKYAYVFPTNTTVSWSFDQSNATVRTDFTISKEIKEGTNTDLLLGLLPHQWSNLAPDSPKPMEESYSSVRGELKMLSDDHFSVENKFRGILPTLPYLSNYSEGFNVATLNEKVETIKNDQLSTWTDSYNEGQVMNRLIQTGRIAHEMDNTEALNTILATVKERLEDWLSVEASEVAFLFYYNTDWSSLIGYPAGHGQDNNINDHHFHWGYFIHAAAFIEQFEPGWVNQWGGMVNHLVRDAASARRDDAMFPFLRNFSPYAGHSWANGFASFPQGNDQESTSESMQFNSSLIHWGAITGNDEIRDLGIYLYTTEQSAIEEYWFDIHERIFSSSQQYSLVSRVWGNSYDNGTFWTTDIEASYGIELYPIHGGSMYLGHNETYAEKLWSEIENNTGILSNEANVNLWHDVMWKYLAFTDPSKAIELYDSYPDRNLKFGVSDAQTYYWLHAMNASGKIDTSITADYPLAVAFNKNDDYTYAAHNYSSDEITVNFSDGFSLSVPARSMATNKDVDISASISSSFSSAYPGGNVTLTVNTENQVVSRVVFYQDGVNIGEDLVSPYILKTNSLVSGQPSFYAKVYQADLFDVTNIVSVTVGSQRPFNGVLTEIPGTLDAGHYDTFEGGSGQGISYVDFTPNNQGDYRSGEAVDAALSNTEGATIGWITSGEWVEYTVNVAQSGLYHLSFRYASGNQSGGGPFYIELDDQRISNNITLNYTSDWDEWESKSVSGLAIPAGEHVLKLVFENGEFNIGRMIFSFQENLSYGHPVANAGDNVSVRLPNSTAILDGSSSFDPDGNASLTYRWEQLNGPSFISFSNSSDISPTVSNLEEGIYTFELFVSDGTYHSTDQVFIIVSETGNSLPTVFITSPENNASYEENRNIQITASASDLDGDITKVEFYDGTTKLGEDSTEPYSFLWGDVSIGSHSLSATATDNTGGQGNSQVINISVNETFQCSETSSNAQQGSFSTGYRTTFQTIGNQVKITFELLDNDKSGVIAYLWRASPFSEVQMDHVSGNTFSRTVSGFTAGETISYGCKFAFTGGLAVTQYISYEVASSCQTTHQLSLEDEEINLAENSLTGAIVYTPTPNYSGNSPLNYSILNGNDEGTFGINTTTGTITVSNSSLLNSEIVPKFQLGLFVSDGTLSDESVLTINIGQTVVTNLSDEDKNNLEEQNVLLFPNPVQGSFQIDLGRNYNEIKVIIYTLDGKRAMNKTFYQTNKLMLDGSTLPKGTHILYLILEGKVKILKIVKS